MTATEWDVLLSTPVDVGDLGLHQDADVAAAAFRRQLAREFASSALIEHGAAAEKQFREMRSLLAGRPVLWSGFLMLLTPAAAGLPVDGVVEPTGDVEEDARLRGLAAVPAVFLVVLSVRVRHLPEPATEGPMSQAAALARALGHQFGADGNVHRVRYGDVQGVASVRIAKDNVAGTSVGGLSFAADSPPAERLVAEVSLLFPEEQALVTVSAVVSHGAALEEAIVLVGAIAGTVRVRRTCADAGPDGTPAAGALVAKPAAPVRPRARTVPLDPATTAAPVPLRVFLPDGSLLAAGSTVVGRSPARDVADRVVRVRDESVSRTHLLLRLENGRASVTDLGSSNGTVLVRGSEAPTPLPRHEEVALMEGDIVVLGAERIIITRDESPAGRA